MPNSKYKLTKFDGYSLVYALVGILILSTICLIFLIYINHINQYTAAGIKKELARLYSYQGLNLLDNSELGYSTDYVYDLNDEFELIINKRIWGGFELFSSTIIENTDTLCKKIALVGLFQDTTDNTALMFENSTSILSVADNVSINGNCYVPMGLLKRKSGTKNQPSTPLTIRESPEKIPALQNYDLVIGELLSIDKYNIHSLSITDSMTNSFSNVTQVISADSLFISGNISGNIVLTANSIFIDSNATLDGPLVLGKSIVIRANKCSNMQIFAQDKLFIGKNTTLKYPSLLCMFSAELQDDNKYRSIVIEDSCIIAGDIYITKSEEANNVHVELNKTSKITGCIYSQFPVALQGIVYGRVICNSSINSEYGRVQKNMIDNLRIDVDSLPYYYAHSILYPTKGRKKIVSWRD